MRRTTRWVAGMAAIAGTILAATAPASARPDTARVTGSADFMLPFDPDDDVRSFAFDVRSTPYTTPIPGLPHGLPTDATGTVRVSHFVPAQQLTVRFEATVDCLVTSPGLATLTAVVTRADSVVADWVGKRVGFSVQDGGRGHGDRVGFTWSFSGDQDADGTWHEARIGTCLAPAPFAVVTRGDYTLRHAELKPMPVG
ncbi:hypothetical protein [Actinoplanes palleronii]|uniref:Uncharacterized protein n=1 Tax=Actinoplanes palleronii TaxID=113570 RepID=A0ABQ4BLH2_9ACTN|nr:hypothetical protein [Actinoplanes palleronii]GIE71524.1 hypothetical protein Apa02nite_076320 [Actinoplanes palleronii]